VRAVANLVMFFSALFLVALGVVIMIVDTANQGFVVGLFLLMGGIFLWGVSLNYGDPPVTRPEELLEPSDPGGSPSEG
jgi:hypothetical protein